jgi:hypothetical protein
MNEQNQPEQNIQPILLHLEEGLKEVLRNTERGLRTNVAERLKTYPSRKAWIRKNVRDSHRVDEFVHDLERDETIDKNILAFLSLLDEALVSIPENKRE